MKADRNGNNRPMGRWIETERMIGAYEKLRGITEGLPRHRGW